MISAIILTKNEEKNIVDCIDGVLWCDEILVIDSDSEDRTVELAKRAGAKVFSYSFEGDFSKQRNFALDKAQGEWVLFVDADERVSDVLQKEISFKLSDPQRSRLSGYRVKRLDTLFGKKLKHGEVKDIWLIRLARKDKGVWKGKVHEVWEIIGDVENLESALFHYPHDTVDEFLRELNLYSDIRALELYEQKKRVSGFGIVFYPLGKFLYTYFSKLGFLGGTSGFLLSTLMSFYSFLVRGKLWLLWHKK